MKISLKWISDYVDIQEFMHQPQKLAEVLVRAGLEVDAIENLKEQFNNVVIGHIVELARHPNADRLTVCQVDVGDGVLKQIVCGAKNHKQGDRVVVALPGAVLPGDFAIKLSKIRDVESSGMLCSESELGFSKESEGIVILPADAPIGKDFASYKSLDDVILDIAVTANRSDCLSHLGMARELSCLLNRPLKVPNVEIEKPVGSTKKVVSLEVRSEDLCPRYAGRWVTQVKVGPTPDWISQRLERVGVNSINNVVDITNYVMLELGQPLHAFDLKNLKSAKVIVDKAKKAEKFKSLDGTEFTLDGDELTIRDGEKAVALAGVVGGEFSGVSESTTDVFLESAYFLPRTVRRTARKLGIETDSAYRFSRGCDPEMVLLALNRACALMQKYASGQVAADNYDFYPKPIKKQNIEIAKSQLDERLGYAANFEDFSQWMKRLGCGLGSGRDKNTLQILPPTFRADLETKEDLIEEYARLNGYDKIPESFPALCNEPKAVASEYAFEKRVTEILVTEGFNQAVNYGFLSQSFQKDFVGDIKAIQDSGLEFSDSPVALKNPLSEDLNVMRQLLTPGLFKNLVHNFRHNSKLGRIFEVGQVFHCDVDTADYRYKQSLQLGLVAWGQAEELWRKETARPVVYDLKTALESLLKKLQITGFQWREMKKAPSFCHPGQVLALFVEGQLLGFIGSMHPQLNEEYKLRTDVAFAEVNLEKLMRGQPRTPKITVISKFPSVERDFAFVMPKALSVGDVTQAIKKLAGKILQRVDVFDIYEGKPLADTEKSVAFRLIYQDPSATLSDEQLQASQKTIIESLSKKFNIQVR